MNINEYGERLLMWGVKHIILICAVVVCGMLCCALQILHDANKRQRDSLSCPTITETSSIRYDNGGLVQVDIKHGRLCADGTLTYDNGHWTNIK